VFVCVCVCNSSLSVWNNIPPVIILKLHTRIPYALILAHSKRHEQK
jgi:hypothetical protein